MAVAISPTVRAILSTNIDMLADEVIKRAKAKGVIAPERNIRIAVHNTRSEMKRQKPVMAAAAARMTAPAKMAATPVKTTAALKPAAPSAKMSASKPVVSTPTDVNIVFSNVNLVNKVVGVAGGVDQARQVAEAVRSCGGVEPFLKHLELVAGIKLA